MEMLSDILKQLELNTSFFYQLIIVVTFFVICKYLFLDQLKENIEERERKTSKLEDSAEETFKEIDKLTFDYEEKIKQATNANREEMNSLKQGIDSEVNKVVHAEEAKIQQQYDESKKIIDEEMSNKKQKILEEAESLSSLLIQKLSSKK
jgi:F-type H+-transporting ATPase subunit b